MSSPHRSSNGDGNICRHYRKHGNCKYGDRCRAVHDFNPFLTATELAGDMVPGNSEEHSAATICRHYAKSRSCNFGDTCKYVHHFEPIPVSEEAAGSMPHRANTICVHYARTGSCRFGDRCRYGIHELPPPQTTSSSRQQNQVCIACAVGQIEVAYSGCGHMSLCRNCHELAHPSLGRCPICKCQSDRIVVRAVGFEL